MRTTFEKIVCNAQLSSDDGECLTDIRLEYEPNTDFSDFRVKLNEGWYDIEELQELLRGLRAFKLETKGLR